MARWSFRRPALRQRCLDLAVTATSSVVGVERFGGRGLVRWSIQQVARMSGVTARTLRYYDEIGLLRPAGVGTNGYRYYEQSSCCGYSRSCCCASWAWT